MSKQKRKQCPGRVVGQRGWAVGANHSDDARLIAFSVNPRLLVSADMLCPRAFNVQYWTEAGGMRGVGSEASTHVRKKDVRTSPSSAQACTGNRCQPIEREKLCSAGYYGRKPTLRPNFVSMAAMRARIV